MQLGFKTRTRILVLLLFIQLALNCSQAAAFERIITLSPGLAEWTAAVLGDQLAKTKIIGVSEYSYYPSFLKAVKTIGPYPQINVERIASLKPDLVLAAEEYNRPEQLEQLKRLKLPLVILPAEHFASMAGWITQLGQALKQEKAAGEQVKLWQSALSELGRMKKPVRQRLFIEIQHQPLVTVGAPSFLTDSFALVGFDNVFARLPQAYPKVSKESVLKENPELILILDLTGAKDDFEKAKQDWLQLSSLKASKTNQIRTIPGDNMHAVVCGC